MSRSVVQGGPQPELSDLVLFLDAGSRISYPGAGSVWYDLSGLGNNFNLNNSPTNNGKFFTFNGTNQSATCSNTTCGNFGTGSFTIEYAVNYSDKKVNTGCVIQKRGNYISLGSNSLAGFIHRVGSDQFCIQDALPSGSPSPPFGWNNNTGVINDATALVTGSNQHIVHTLTNDGIGTMTGRIYRNGILVSTDIYNWGIYSASNPGSVNNGNSIVLMFTQGAGTYLPGNLYYVRLYNKALSVKEIQQNWQAARGLLDL